MRSSAPPASTLGTASDIAPRLHLPLERAALCLDCGSVFEVGPRCPACANECFAPLSRFLNRPLAS